MIGGLIALLKATPAVTAIVGQSVYPVLMPETVTLPAITVHRVGGTSSPTFQTSGFQRLRLQFDSHASEFLQAEQAQVAILNVLNGYVGKLPDGTVVQNIDFIQPLDFFDNEPRQFRCGSEFYAYFTL